MFAVLSVIAFAVALILHLAGTGHLVLDFELAGFICVALELVFAGGPPWSRR
jgi:hypothetical protein